VHLKLNIGAFYIIY